MENRKQRLRDKEEALSLTCMHLGVPGEKERK